MLWNSDVFVVEFKRHGGEFDMRDEKGIIKNNPQVKVRRLRTIGTT